MKKIQLEDIKVFTFAEAEHGKLSEIGVVVTHGGPRPHFILCEIAENQGFHGGENIISVCMEVRKLFAPDVSLSEIRWQYLNGYQSSTFDFKTVNDWPLFISCEHSGPFSEMHTKTPLAKYPDLVNEHVQSNYMGPQCAATSVILPLNTERGYMCMEWKQPNPAIYIYSRLYLVDTSRFAEIFLPTIKNNQRLNECFNREGAQKYLIDAYAEKMPFENPLQPAEISYYPQDAQLFGFTNGRHRTLNLISIEVPFIPMHVQAHDDATHRDFQQKFGWKSSGDFGVSPQIGFSSLRP